MEFEVIHEFSNIGERNDVRMRVVDKLSMELPGTGRGDQATRYKYYVEELNNGCRIFLRRPANLHYGFDFLVCIENINFNPKGKARNYPKQDDIIFDLVDKLIEDKRKYKLLKEHIDQVYRCESEVDFVKLRNLKFKTGFPSDLIVTSLKWLFIEQDVRYWNYSGRDMLWYALNDIGK